MKENLKAICSGFYDLQQLRIQTGNRIVANFKIRLGQATSEPEKELDKEGKEILERIRKAYKLIADAAADLPRVGKFEGNEVISDYAELTLASMYESLYEREESYLKMIKSIVHTEPFWKYWMKDVKGLGELLALAIFAKIDISKARHPSSLWKYCGVDVAPDGKGRSRSQEHLVTVEYLDKETSEIKSKQGISFNPWIKTKLLGVLGSSFLRAGDNKYSKIYYDYRHRLESHPKYKDGGTAPTKSKNGKQLPSPKQHRHAMATRYMIKMFLVDLYSAWREFEGLPVSKPYNESKLGIGHGRAA